MAQVFAQRIMFFKSFHPICSSLRKDKLVVVILCPGTVFPYMDIWIVLEFAHLALHTYDRHVYTLLTALGFFRRLDKTYCLQQRIKLSVMYIVIESCYLRKWRNDEIVCRQTFNVSLE